MTFDNKTKMTIAQMCGENNLFGLIEKLENLLPKFDATIKNGNAHHIKKFIAFLYDYIENPMSAKLPLICNLYETGCFVVFSSCTLSNPSSLIVARACRSSSPSRLVSSTDSTTRSPGRMVLLNWAST